MTRKVFQWKFTSCQYNIENANGFKTYSASEGLTEEDREDFVRFAGSYASPDNYPDRPTQDELKLFPISLASFRLRSGKRAIVRTRYVGKDYSGVRWGNFFSHGLALPEGADWDFYPIQLWDSPIFADGLTLEEQTLGHTPPPLPELEIRDDDLRDWSKEINVLFESGVVRRRFFGALISAVRRSQSSGRRVLLCDAQKNLPLWIAATQYLYPPRWAQEIHFSTYSHLLANARLFHLTCDVSGKKDASFSAEASKYSLSFFDAGANATSAPTSELDAIINALDFDGEYFPGLKLERDNRERADWNASVFDGSLETLDVLFNFLRQDDAENEPTANYFQDDSSAAPVPQRLKNAFAFLKTNPWRLRRSALEIASTPRPRKIADANVAYEFMSTLIDSFLTARDAENVDVKALEQYLAVFFNFVARQFVVAPKDAGKIAGAGFQKLRALFDKNNQARRNLGLNLLERLKRDERAPLYFLEFALAVLLSPKIEEEIELFDQALRNLPPSDALAFLDAVLPYTIDYAAETTEATHKSLFELSRKYSEADENCSPERRYVGYMALCRQNKGKTVDKQVFAFLKFVVNMSQARVFAASNNFYREGANAICKLLNLDAASDDAKRQTVYNALINELGDLNKNAKSNLKELVFNNDRVYAGRRVPGDNFFARNWLALTIAAVLLVAIGTGIAVLATSLSSSNSTGASSSNLPAVQTDSTPPADSVGN